MISSRQPITCSNGILLNLVFPVTKSLALFNHTSVPCDNPDILTISVNVFGRESFNISRTNLVPISGTPKLATSVSKLSSSGVNPIDSVEFNKLYTFGSSNGISVASLNGKSRGFSFT